MANPLKITIDVSAKWHEEQISKDLNQPWEVSKGA